MPFSKSKKYSCCFCSDLTKNSSKKINFCRDCKKIRDHIRDKGIMSILSIINNDKEKLASAPPYNI